MATAFRTLVRCHVCGFSEVRTDAVLESGTLWLHECPRCDHRWTERAPGERPVRMLRTLRERPRAA